jgi:RNA polymerase sigma factor (TIGR02999 family)
MGDVTLILSQIERGDGQAADELLPLVYDELRKLAAQYMAQEDPGQTLQATALVHEAYVRLVDVEKTQHWNSRGHFFSAAAEAMRRILVEAARRKKLPQRGGDLRRVPLDDALDVTRMPSDELLDLNDALSRLEAKDEIAGRLVKLRYFAGLSMRQASETLGIPLRSAHRDWTYARTWLYRELRKGDSRLSV